MLAPARLLSSPGRCEAAFRMTSRSSCRRGRKAVRFQSCPQKGQLLEFVKKIPFSERFKELSTRKLSPLGDEILRVRSTMKTLYARPLLAAILAVTLVGGPISPAFGQDTPQTPQAAPAKVATPIVPVSLGSAKYNYTRAPRPFPTLFAPYSPLKIRAASLPNSPRIDHLIHTD